MKAINAPDYVIWRVLIVTPVYGLPIYSNITVSSSVLATQTRVPSVVSEPGFRPTEYVSSKSPVEALSFSTVLSAEFAIQI